MASVFSDLPVPRRDFVHIWSKMPMKTALGTASHGHLKIIFV
jgi:hypothetical protein